MSVLIHCDLPSCDETTLLMDPDLRWLVVGPVSEVNVTVYGEQPGPKHYCSSECLVEAYGD